MLYTVYILYLVHVVHRTCYTQYYVSHTVQSTFCTLFTLNTVYTVQYTTHSSHWTQYMLDKVKRGNHFMLFFFYKNILECYLNTKTFIFNPSLRKYQVVNLLLTVVKVTYWTLYSSVYVRIELFMVRYSGKKLNRPFLNHPKHFLNNQEE